MPLPDEAVAPLVLRPRHLRHWSCLMSGLALSVFAGVQLTSEGNPSVLGFIALLLWSFGFWNIDYSGTRQILLFPDRITLDKRYGSRTLTLAELKGYRRTDTLWSFVELVPVDAFAKSARISLVAFKGQALDVWLLRLPDLDAAQRTAREAEIGQDLRLGATPEERVARAASLSRRIRLLAIGYAVAAVVLVKFPYPAWLPLLLVLAAPWLALGLLRHPHLGCSLFGSGVQVEQRDRDLGWLLLGPGMAMLDVLSGRIAPLPAVPELLLLARPQLVLEFVLLSSVVWLQGTGERSLAARRVVIATLAAVYAVGTVVIANAVLDRHAAHPQPLWVLDKYRNSHSGGGSYFLVADTRHAGLVGRSVRVANAALYQAAQYGNVVCAYVHPGALGLEWRTVDLCDLSARMP